jgi:hypothetical protein
VVALLFQERPHRHADGRKHLTSRSVLFLLFVYTTQGVVEVPGNQKISSSKLTLGTTEPIAKAVLRSGL